MLVASVDGVDDVVGDFVVVLAPVAVAVLLLLFTLVQNLPDFTGNTINQ